MAWHRHCPPGFGVIPLGVLLCCVVRCVTDAGDVESARCRVRCLAHLKHKLSSTGDAHITFERCFQDDTCTACLRPCGQPYISLTHCVHLCQTQCHVCQTTEDDCEQSCRFLKHLRTVRPGVCPSPGTFGGLTSGCIDECDLDSECDGVRKCCGNSCAQVCQMPKQLYVGVPDIPRITTIRERENTGVVELSWQSSLANHSAPLLYMVQSRYNVGSHYSDLHMTPWQQITQTTDTSMVVRDMGPGRWYSFRISAISINGTRGYSNPSQPYKLQKEPLPPGAPQNLTEGQTKFQDGRMTVMVHWDPPVLSDLPVARYKVYWSKRVKNAYPDDVPVRENKRLVPGNELRYELDDLEENTEYLVQVQAISVYGDIRLKSERCSMDLRTSSVQSTTQNDSPPAVVEIQSLATLPALKNIIIHSMYFYNGILKANVTWDYPTGYSPQSHKVTIHWTAQVCIADESDSSVAQPMSATTHAEFFILYGLRFDCWYRVKLQLTDSNGEVGEVTQLSFASPPCDSVHVIGPVLPICPTHSPIPPEEPPSLTYSFLIMQTNITAKLRWEQPASVMEITSYRLVWGQTLQDTEQLNPILNQETALTKVLPKGVQIFHIGNLQSSTGYLVQLQALSPAGSSRTAEIFFQTPMVKQQPGVPPYKSEGFDARSWQGQGHGATAGPLPSSPLPYGVHHNSAAAMSWSYALIYTGFLIIKFMFVLCR